VIVEHLLRHVELEELDLHVAWMTPQIKARLAALPRLSRLSVGF
jgi:hypothetical protein